MANGPNIFQMLLVFSCKLVKYYAHTGKAYKRSTLMCQMWSRSVYSVAFLAEKTPKWLAFFNFGVLWCRLLAAYRKSLVFFAARERQ